LLKTIAIALLKNPLGLVTVATPFIIDYIQTEKAKLTAAASHRASELQQASKIADEIMCTMDKLAYLSKQAMFGVVFRGRTTADDQAAWKEYQQILAKWEGSKSTSFAQVEMYFGAESAARLKRIQEDFGTLINQVDAAFFKRDKSKWFIEDKEGSGNDFRGKYFPVWNRLNAEMTELSKEMIGSIQQEAVGSLRRGA
jgi:hypothetical protein